MDFFWIKWVTVTVHDDVEDKWTSKKHCYGSNVSVEATEIYVNTWENWVRKWKKKWKKGKKNFIIG